MFFLISVIVFQFHGHIPCVVLSNAVFSKQSDLDDSLEKVFEDGIVKPYVVMEKEGVKFGFFGLIGKHAAEVAPFAFLVSFEDPVYTTKKIVKKLAGKGEGRYCGMPVSQRIVGR